MTHPLTAPQILDREFLEIRAKMLELAASFDRLDRATGTVAGDSRESLIQEGLKLLQQDVPNRAEQLQLLFSREFDDHWRTNFGL
ncbi:hypothetical protein Pla110_04740 [Polystyrenella longa]|uniref:Uncharacterized protein n=1 Tax=Polystyrenella longa TaxID=2528007 RepID=A0A518CHR4_9PLAN|nr:hypothetical protein [Polystyrenella longa]QDU78770.1 hypothetical protein Pla110_04740 [Polystyrenella longa]